MPGKFIMNVRSLIFLVGVLFLLFCGLQITILRKQSSSLTLTRLEEDDLRVLTAPGKKSDSAISKNFSSFYYNMENISQSPLIFIGGYARSGTTLMRALLDVHESVSCGPETKVLPHLLKFLGDYLSKPMNMKEIRNAGLDTGKLNNALRLYIFSIMSEHVRPAERLCAKDPNILYHMRQLGELFPNAKFVGMVRDARASVYSLMRIIGEPITQTTAAKYLVTWNQLYIRLDRDCRALTPSRCKLVKYEDLIRRPNDTIAAVATFLGLEWTDNFLRHEAFVGERVHVSPTEWSSDQIKKPIYASALRSWEHKFNFDPRLVKIKASMMKDFGYQV